MAGMANQRSMSARLFLAFVLAVFLAVVPGARVVPAQSAAAASPVAQAPAVRTAPAADAVAGVRNFTKVDSTISIGGALSPEAYAAIARAGYKSVVNLRTDPEPGANLAAEQQAFKAEGLRYFHLPFSHSTPEAAPIDEFLKIVQDPANQPVLLHCATGTRASMFWAVKRVMVDGWTADRAMNELPALSGHVGPPLRPFILDYLKSHGKTRP